MNFSSGLFGLSVAVSLSEETEVLDKLNAAAAAAAASSQRMNGCWSLGHSEKGQRECESDKDLIKREVGKDCKLQSKKM